MREKTISVNGTVYDSRTGMPLRIERRNDLPARHSAASVHAQLQKSRTLNRKYVHLDAKPAEATSKAMEQTPAVHKISVHAKPARSVAAVKSEQIVHFARPVTPTPKKSSHPRVMDIAPAAHHVVQRAEQRVAQSKPAERVLKPSQLIKQEAIKSAIEHAPAKHTKKQVRNSHSRTGRLASIGMLSLAALVLGAYLTYLNMPALSTRVAATQAGINASYPNYQPTGYSLDGPVAYQQGSITMKFAANAGPEQYTLSQTRSEWDSTAALDNYVIPQAGSNYSTTTTSGLTIYKYGNNAVWVNGGLLYTITGNASLSSEQVQRIATSL